MQFCDMYTKNGKASTQAKWCVHSILPLALRVKQPALHRDINIFVRLSYKHKHRMHWAVELARFQLAAGGGRRSEPNVVLWFLFTFVLGLHGGWGKTWRRQNVSETASHVTGHYASQQCQMRVGCFVKPDVCSSLRCSEWI
jgi:hypothetical protein